MALRRIPRRQVLIGGGSMAALLALRSGQNDMERASAHASLPVSPPASDFLRMLAFVPVADDAAGGLFAFRDRWQGELSFANVGAVKRQYGFENVRNADDIQNTAQDFVYATNGCDVSDFTGKGRGSQWGDAFGYNLFQVDREISAGRPPENFSHMEGGFDADTITAKLRDGGYTAATHAGTVYFTIYGDYQLQMNDLRSRLTFGKMNRVAADAGRITATAATATMDALLDAEARQTHTLADCPTLRALAVALGDVTSMATFPGATTLRKGGLTDAELADVTKGWGTLHVPEITAMGYTDGGSYQRTMHVALVYANPDDATADVPELVNRLTSYRSILTRQPLFMTYATAITSRTVTESGKGVLVADIALVDEPRRGGLWLQMYTGGDTNFFAPQPNTAGSGSG